MSFLMKIFPVPGHLNKGEYTTENGVILGYEPYLSPKTPLISGLPKKFMKKASLAMLQMAKEKLTEKQLKDAIILFSNSYLEYYGEHLPDRGKKKLAQIYHEVINLSFDLNKQLKEKKIKVDEVRKKMAGAMAKMILDEMKLFIKHRKALLCRYRKWRGPDVPDNPKIKEYLVKVFYEYLSGKYVAEDAKKIAKEQDILKNPDSPETRKILCKAKFVIGQIYTDNMTYDVPNFECPEYEYEDTIYPNEVIGWEVHVYRAEHSIIPGFIEDLLDALSPFSWGDLASDIGAVHTSLLVGLYKQYKQRVLRQKINVNSGAVQEDKFTRFGLEFDDWILANGSASWLTSDDALILKKAGRFASRVLAVEWIKGVLWPSDQGKYYRMRASCYSAGMWGINWTCHQNVNAFTHKKWNIQIVDLPTNLLFGPCGNFSDPLAGGPVHMAKQKDPIWGATEIAGGVPGTLLYFNSIPPYAWPPYQILDAIMDPSGYGLSRYWHPDAGNPAGWYDTDADYKIRGRNEIPIQGINTICDIRRGWV